MSNLATKLFPTFFLPLDGGGKLVIIDDWRLLYTH